MCCVESMMIISLLFTHLVGLEYVWTTKDWSGEAHLEQFCEGPDIF